MIVVVDLNQFILGLPYSIQPNLARWCAVLERKKGK